MLAVCFEWSILLFLQFVWAFEYKAQNLEIIEPSPEPLLTGGMLTVLGHLVLQTKTLWRKEMKK